MTQDTFEIDDYTGIVIRDPNLNAMVLALLVNRKNQYPQSIVKDENLLKTELSTRHRMAIEVRLGEKRILQRAREKLTWVAPSPPRYLGGFKRRRLNGD